MRKHVIPYILSVAMSHFTNGFAQTAVTPVSYTTPAGVYTQNFDGLPNTGSFSLTGRGPVNISSSPIIGNNLAGWQVLLAGGSNTNVAFAVGTGSSTGNGVYSFGNLGSTERALGTLASSTGIYAVGILITNNTGSALNTFTVSFTTEQWRKGGSTNKNSWAFRYKTGLFTHIDQTGLMEEPNLQMRSVITTTGAGSLNGNLPENGQIIAFTVDSVNWKNGEQLLLRWDDADESGNDDACAIDNFNFSAAVVSSAPTAVTLAPSTLTADSVILQASINDNFSTTVVTFALDTVNTFLHPTTIKPVPDSINAGKGITNVSATLYGLQPGKNYFFMVKAINSMGVSNGAALNFITPFKLPVVTTLVAVGITTHSADLGGNISSSGGSTITERGIVWSEKNNPTLFDNKIIMGNGTGNFMQQVTGLPSGSNLYARAYATSMAGTAYGNTESFTTQTSIVSLTTTTPSLTNASTVKFILTTKQAVTGLTSANFSLRTSGINGASITSITGSGNTFTVTIHTGSGDGTIGLQFANDNGLSLSIHNKPFAATGLYTIDKTAPAIRSISIPDRSMKIGDSIPVTVMVNPDPDTYKMVTGLINDFTIVAFNKKNDSMYQGVFVIQSGGKDVAASATIETRLSLIDAIGNNSQQFQSTINQSSDPIDANNPLITTMKTPSAGIYKAGDTLDFIFRFTEKVMLTAIGGISGFSITIGTRIKTAGYVGGSGADSALFRYIIQSGESDKDGIKTGSTIILTHTLIKDFAGNTGMGMLNNPPVTKNILIDGIIPAISSVTVPPAAVYKTGNILDFLVTYTKKIIVTTLDSFPAITLGIGNRFKQATYISGSGGTTLLFRYMIEADDMDKDGIKLVSPLAVNTATIKDEAGNHALLVLNNVGASSNIKINPATVAVSNVSGPLPGIYRAGDTLEYLVDFTEKVWVSGNIPSLKINIGSNSRHAYYYNGSAGNRLSFIYAIQPGDEDTNGVTINTNISFNTGFIKDERGNSVPASLNNINNRSGIRVDAVHPAVKNVMVPSNHTYKNSDTLDFTVNFTEKIGVDMTNDTPFIKLLLGTAVKKINYSQGSGSASLSFRYIIQKGDLDKNGVKLDTLITGSKSITDFAGNPAIPAIKNVGALSHIKIDAVAPSFAAKSLANLTACENASAVSINESLEVIDEEMGETLTWRVISGVTQGTVSKLVYSASSNGKAILPGSIFYTPTRNYFGNDTIVIQVSDGIHTDQKTVIIQIQPSLKNNTIGPSQIICANNNPLTIAGSTPLGGDGVYQFIWEASASKDSGTYSKASGTNHLPHYAPPPLTSTTWFRRKVLSGECIDFSPPSQVTVLQNGLWTGSVSTDWHNGNNWCNGKVPDKLTAVFLYGNTLYDPIIKDTAICNHLTMASNARLTIKGVLQLKGNISASTETIDVRNGTIVFNGTDIQTIPSACFVDRALKKIVINNPAQVIISSPLIITKHLLLNSGSLITNNNLALKHTANVGASATGTTVIGNVTIEHFIKGGRRAFRLLGHPFSNAIGLLMIKDSIDITGYDGLVNGFTPTATNQPSAFRYDPLTGNDSLGVDAGWTAFTHTNGQAENSWKQGTGIRLLIRGRPGQGLDGATYTPLPVTLSLSGNIHTGDKEILLPARNQVSYHVVANPYASAIDLSLITTGSHMGIHYWIWDPLQANTGGYSSIPFKSKNILPPFGAFIVKTTDTANSTLLFTENCKVNEIASDSLATLHDDDSYYIELRLKTDSVFWDRLILLAKDSAKNFFDKNDAEKFQNSEVNFYSLSREQKMLSIDARPINNETTIPLGLQSVIPGQFSICVAKCSLPASNSLMLHDKYLDKWMKLEKDSSYHFTTTSDSAKGNGRFEITTPKKMTAPPVNQLITTVSPIPATDKILVNYFAPKKGNTHIRMLTLTGMPVKQIALGMQKDGQVMISVADMIRGIYLLEVQSGELTSTRKIIKQ